MPAHVFHGGETLRLDAEGFAWKVSRCGESALDDACTLLADAARRYAGLVFSRPAQDLAPCDASCVASVTIAVQDATPDKTVETDESYELTVKASGIELQAETIFGALHGLETLSQLVTFEADSRSYVIANADWTIRDRPNFAHRELLIDSSRHYVPLPMLRKIIDGMAYTKVNVLHWHIVDEQSFPWCSESVPELCEGAYNARDKYTSEDLRAVVAYARARGVRVIPELDIPGHSASWCRGRPDICTSKGTMISPVGGGAKRVIFALMEELHDIFPDAYVHLGGDEVNLKFWREDPATVAYAIAQKIELKDIYLDFVQSSHAKAVSLGLTPIGWEEVYMNFGDELPKTTVIFGWWHTEAVIKAAKEGYNVLHMPVGEWYFDKRVTYKMIRLVDPCKGFGSGCKYVLGGGGAAWAEKIDASVLLQTIWPRLSGVGEQLWSPPDATGALLERARQFRCHLVRRGIPVAPVEANEDVHGKPQLRPEVPGPGSCLSQ